MVDHGPHGLADRALRAMHTLQRGAVNAGFIFFTLAISAR
jgi:hypothetical protein